MNVNLLRVAPVALVLMMAAPVLADDAGASDAGVDDAGTLLAGGAPQVASAPTLDFQSTPLDAEPEVGPGTLLLQTAVGLGLVVALIYLTLNIGLRKLLGIKTVPKGQSKVSVIERVALDQKRVLFVVRAGKEVLLVGGAEENLNLITKLDPADFVFDPEPAEGSGIQMSPFLKKLLGRKEAPKPPPT